MDCSSYLRYLLTDTASLRSYCQEQKAVCLDDVKRSVLLAVRGRDTSVPDHYYRLGTEKSFGDIRSLSSLFTVGLSQLAAEYLDLRDGKVYVKGERLGDWQQLLPLMPSLLMVTLRIWSARAPFNGPLSATARTYLQPSLLHTALPEPFLPEMDALRRERHGVSDLHIHLNGTVETDRAWQDFLRHPEALYKELLTAYRKDGKVREQYGQLTEGGTPFLFYRLFLIAGRLRHWLYYRVLCRTDIFQATSFSDLLRQIDSCHTAYKTHPMHLAVGSSVSPLIAEGLLYLKVLDYLAAWPADDTVARAFHYYLLILGLCNRLLVQQTDASGFEQFQKYTSNGFREFSEQHYAERFRQLAGNDLCSLRHVEGRFSPKDTREKDDLHIRRINDGFLRLVRLQRLQGIPSTSLSLVAHFIKRADTATGDIRHRQLRRKLEDQTSALIALLDSKGRSARLVTGVDAAASEFDTPPEVFAPSFRRLRGQGVRHFTYHAGEDFYHVLSGLRAIYEAMEFLDLRAGDRIGHAVAAGIDVQLWKKDIGDRLWMRIGDYLDDLVFACHLITESKAKELEHLLPALTQRIEQYASDIYPEPYTLHELIEAWKLRADDPRRLYYGLERPSRIQSAFLSYHSQEGQKRGGRIVEVDAFDLLDMDELVLLQRLVLCDMHRRQIVIETLPTSNVVIGHYRSFATYHLYNWYRWAREGERVPAIVVGTDDAGVFATQPYNEYCHIYRTLVFDHGLSPDEARDYIVRLMHNAEIYAFRSP